MIPFRIPAELVAGPAWRPSSTFLRLPPEILLQCFQEADAIDAIALAASCKTLLHISVLHGPDVPDRLMHRAPWVTGGDDAVSSPGPRCDCDRLEDLLRRLRPRDAQGRLSRTCTLCVDCARYRPAKKGYWAAQLARMDTGEWDRPDGQLWRSAVAWFAAGVKMQCPPCRMAEHWMEEEKEEEAAML
ncbi:hypothetical protein CDD83_4323 [Cordyceps sp. RAO-2017]|nr:hypothetical protein CDD83_4323 [Cordyceps sp. RAO-2017]